MTTYLNHYWFVSLFGIVLLAVPASVRWSLDARRRGPRSIPVGALWLVRGAGRGGLRVRGAGEAQRRLARARPTAPHVAAPAVRPGDRRPLARRTVGRAGSELDGRGVRPAGRPRVVLATDPAVRVGRDRRVPRRHVAALPHRRVPVADDRGVDGVLRARLAQSPPRARAAGVNRSVPRFRRRARVRATDGYDRATTAAARRRARGRVGRAPGARPAPALGRSGRLPLDERGLPLRVGRAPHREGRRRELPGHGTRDRSSLDRDRAGPLHAEPVAGDDHRARTDPAGRPRRRRAARRPRRAGSRCGPMRSWRSTAGRRLASSTPGSTWRASRGASTNVGYSPHRPDRAGAGRCHA